VTTLRAGGETDVGRVRDHNEDRFLTTDGLFVVADGVGGHRAGEGASRKAVGALGQAFADPGSAGRLEPVEGANRRV